MKQDLKAIPAELKQLVTDEKAAFAQLKASNAAYLAYAKNLLATDLNTIKSLAKIGIPSSKSKLCSSRNNQQDPQLITAVAIPHIPLVGVPLS